MGQRIEVGDLVKIKRTGDEEGIPEHSLTYEVVGRDRFGKIWISLTDGEYDGYSGDLILCPAPTGWWNVALSDERSSVSRVVELEVNNV
jgi:hypothetical protein